MEYQEFININARVSGSLSRENYVKNKYPEWYIELCKFREDLESKGIKELAFKELIYYRFKENKTPENKKCYCGNPLKFYSIEKGYSLYCGSSCANKATTEKIKNVKLLKYGDSNYNNKEQFKKSIKVKIEKEGDSILDKRRKTKLLKYGDPNFTNTQKIIKSKKNTSLNYANAKCKKYNVNVIDILEYSSYQILCNKCGIESRMTNTRLNVRLRSQKDPCPVCNNYNSGKSSTEKEISSFIKDLGIGIIENTRSVLGGMEIDIYIPSLKIGFEYNGLYWHSELNLDPIYHQRKQDLALVKGIKLINIWEDDWRDKNDIVKSKIRHTLGLTENTIFARKCTIKEVDFKTSKIFLNENHIQGFCPFKNSIGLYYEDALVSLCTFGSRKISGKSERELLRFTNEKNHHIPGGFSKILRYYLKKYGVKEIVTFADRCWTPRSESIYTKTGFEFLYSTKPNYFYIEDHTRYHRYNYRKDILVKQGYPKNLTEKEIMMDRKIFRIYDCGQYKYSINLL